MTTSLFAQYAVIALAVALSAGHVVQKQWPQALRAVRIGCAIPLLREGRADWVQWIGRAIAPAPRLAGEGGCGGCNGCETDAAQHQGLNARSSPSSWYRRRRTSPPTA